MGQSRPLFCLFSSISYSNINKNAIQIENSVDGVQGIRTWGHRMVGSDKTTEQIQLLISSMVWRLGQEETLFWAHKWLILTLFQIQFKFKLER